MKSITLIFLLTISVSVFSQKTITSVNTDYLKKSKNQKIAAWSLLGSGFVMGGIGTIMALKEVAPIIVFGAWGLPPENQNLHKGTAWMVIGSAAVVASIPLFIAASRNKYKAKSLSFKYDSAPQLVQNNLIRVPIPSINFKINL